MPSKLPKLFWGLSNEQRRLLAARMLEAGHSGDELERAIRLAIWGEGSSRRMSVSCLLLLLSVLLGVGVVGLQPGANSIYLVYLVFLV